jgi:hypothetical protein
MRNAEWGMVESGEWRENSDQWPVGSESEGRELARSARVSRPPAGGPTVGLQVTRQRSGTGRPSVEEDGRVRRPCPNQLNSSLATRHSCVACSRAEVSPAGICAAVGHGEVPIAHALNGDKKETALGPGRRSNLDCLCRGSTYNSSLRWSTLCVEGWPFFFPWF